MKRRGGTRRLVYRMPYRDVEPLSKQLTIIVGLTVVGFMAFGLALSFYRNILFEETLRELEARNEEIADQIDRSYRDLDYFRSNQYKDKYAKENLGKVNQGEKVLIITNPPDPREIEAASGAMIDEQKEAAYFELLRQMPVKEQWWLYLFERDRLEELKAAL